MSTEVRDDVARGALAEVRRLASMAWPISVAQLGWMMQSVVDLAMVGRLGSDALGAVSLGNTWTFAGLILGLGVCFGLDPLIAQAWGAQDRHAHRDALARGAVLVTMLTLPLLAMHLLAQPALSALGQPAEMLERTGVYAATLAPGVWPLLIFTLLRQSLQARGRMQPAMWVMLVANLVNVAANAVLIYGVGSWDGLGVAGAGISTSLVRWFSLAALLPWADLEVTLLREAWQAGAPWRGLGPLARIAVPVGLQTGMEVWAFSCMLLVMGWIGPDAVAAHTVVLNLASVSFMVPLGIGGAAAARVGNLVGAGESWSLSAALAVALGAGVMALAAAVFLLLPEVLVQLYLPEPSPARTLAVLLLPYAAMFQVFDGIQVVSFGVLRGAGDTTMPALANLVGYYLIGIPGGVALALHAGWGPQGVWVGLLVSLGIVATLLTIRLFVLSRRGVSRVSMRVEGSE